MKLTPKRQALINDAIVVGYKVDYLPTCVDIYKKKRGVRLYEDGTAHRMFVELGSATVLRSLESCRKILGV